jgi:hypothetical protein
MRIRASVLLYVPLVTVLVTGCTDQAPAPAAPPANSPAVTSEQPTKGSSNVVRKKKDPTALSTGPTDVVP